MRYGSKGIAVLVVCLFAPAVYGQFGVKVPDKPKSGDVKKVDKFVKAADLAYTKVRGLSVQVPNQVTDLTDEIMGIQDLPLGEGMMEKYDGIKGELMGAVKTVETTHIGDLKSLQEANSAVDGASKDLLSFMKEVTSTEEVKKALGAADLEALETKAKKYLDTDTKDAKTATTKSTEAAKKAPAASKAYALGVAEDHVVKLTDKRKITVGEAEGLIKNGGEHAKKWQAIAQRRVSTMKEMIGILGLQ